MTTFPDEKQTLLHLAVTASAGHLTKWYARALTDVQMNALSPRAYFLTFAATQCALSRVIAGVVWQATEHTRHWRPQ